MTNVLVTVHPQWGNALATAGSGPAQRIVPKRLPEVLDKYVDALTAVWLSGVNHDPELAAIWLSETERKDHVPDLLRDSINRAQGIELTDRNIRAELAIC